jgi:hypothetical protein
MLSGRRLDLLDLPARRGDRRHRRSPVARWNAQTATSIRSRSSPLVESMRMRSALAAAGSRLFTDAPEL